MHMPIKREAKDLSFFVGIGSGLNPISMLVPMATTGLTVSVGFSRSGFWENAGPIAIGLPFFLRTDNLHTVFVAFYATFSSMTRKCVVQYPKIR